jgi:hypothetical protein
MSIGITGCHRGGNLCFSLLLLLHCGNKMQLSAIYVPANKVGMEKSGGEGGIRTPGRGFGPYNGLANLTTFLSRSESFGLYYIPQAVTTPRC